MRNLKHNTYIYFLMLFVLFPVCSQDKEIELPQKFLRLNILSKYSLEKINIRDVKGKLYFNDLSISLKKNFDIQLRKINNRLLLKYDGKEYSSEHLILEADEIFTINYTTENASGERNYSGRLEIFIFDDRLQLVLQTDIEHYVKNTAWAESKNILENSELFSSNEEKFNFTRAMEISVRSWVFSNLKRHSEIDADLCDLTHCMFYPGIIKFQSGDRSPAEVMVHEGKIISSYFHSSCGGVLSGPEVFWEKHFPYSYFRKGEDRFQKFSKLQCEKSPHNRWESHVSEKELMRIFNLSKIENIELIRKQNRIHRIYFPGSNLNLAFSEFSTRMGKDLGWNVIKSNLFDVKKTQRGYIFYGRGLGHGVGLCQWGSAGMASESYDYREILEFYFPGIDIAVGTYK
ncbi:MAG: SpoIID/LytB domain-containing protein [Spirochaetia bacterium]|nr:SpoIID/LytB domain-containing protein [Spirochaetia bacterium]